MSYLQDKKTKRKKFIKITIFILALLGLLYFSSQIFKTTSYTTHAIFRPILIVGNSIGASLSRISGYFYFKTALLRENENLKTQLQEQSARMTDYNAILDENLKLKESMGREGINSERILAAILAKPNQTIYDTLVIDIGQNKNIEIGDKVFSLGGVPLGRVDLVSAFSSTVILYSSSGEKTQGVITGRDVFMSLVGRGGGNFEIVLPRDFLVNHGDEVVLPGITPRTIAIVDSVVSDPRDAFIKALLVSPVNVQEIKFVEVEK